MMSTVAESNLGFGGLPLPRTFRHSSEENDKSLINEIKAGGISRSASITIILSESKN